MPPYDPYGRTDERDRSVAARRPLITRPAFWLVLVALVLAFATALAAGAFVGANTEADAAPDAVRPTPAAAAPATVVVPPPPAAPAIAPDCASIYTYDWTSEFADLLELEPEWAQGQEYWGTEDPAALELLTAASGLRCAWLAVDESDSAMITNVAAVTPDQEAQAIDALAAAGYECYDDLGGTRCIVEFEAESGTTGESHFVREGVWVASRWVNLTVEGYTADIVATLFP